MDILIIFSALFFVISIVLFSFTFFTYKKRKQEERSLSSNLEEKEVDKSKSLRIPNEDIKEEIKENQQKENISDQPSPISNIKEEKKFLINNGDTCFTCSKGKLILNKSKKSKKYLFFCDSCKSVFAPNSKIPIYDNFNKEKIVKELEIDKEYAFEKGDTCPTCKKDKLVFRQNKKTKKYFLTCYNFYCDGIKNVKVVKKESTSVTQEEKTTEKKQEESNPFGSLKCSTCKNTSLRLENNNQTNHTFYYCYMCNSSDVPMDSPKETIKKEPKTTKKKKEDTSSVIIKRGDTCYSCGKGEFLTSISRKTSKTYFNCSLCEQTHFND